MMTVKIIHYPENKGKTTEVFETSEFRIEEGWFPHLGADPFAACDKSYGYFNDTLKDRTWAAMAVTDEGILLLLPNSEIYVMHDGKTVSSVKPMILDYIGGEMKIDGTIKGRDLVTVINRK